MCPYRAAALYDGLRWVEPSIYTPGAGHRPPVLAGRDALIQGWQLMPNDVAVRGRVGARDVILAGPRGIGKTAVLWRSETFAARAITR
jgi:hypothetical protein